MRVLPRFPLLPLMPSSRSLSPRPCTVDEMHAEEATNRRTSNRISASDSLTTGPLYDLSKKEDVEKLGLVEGNPGYFVLKHDPTCQFFARAIRYSDSDRHDQILWETQGQLQSSDVEAVIKAMVKHGQAVHINTGTHGRPDG
eukprot:761164-Hanusia_phi.AAC.2